MTATSDMFRIRLYIWFKPLLMKRGKKLKNRQFAARILQLLSFSRSGSLSGRPASIAILVPERYGDCILLTQLLAQLHAAEPDLSIHLITFRKSSCRFFATDPHVASLFYVKSGVWKWLLFTLTHRFDVLFNPKDSQSVSFLLQSVLLRARFKVGHLNESHAGIYDRLIDLDYYTHVTLRNGELLRVLGMELPRGHTSSPYLPPMAVSEDVRSFCTAIARQDCIGINLSAGSVGKCWSMEKWTELIGAWPNERFVIFSTPVDADIKHALEQRLDNVIASPSTANLGEVGGIVRNLKLLITPDTSLVHIASCFNTPVVALYRNRLNDRTRFAPLSSYQEIVVSPDSRVNSIKVDTVCKAVRNLMSKLREDNGLSSHSVLR
jgi:heptosyltransferase III